MNYTGWYADISKPFRSPGARRALALFDKLAVYAMAAIYFAVLIWLAWQAIAQGAGWARFLRALLVPAVTFALITVVRSSLNRKRPYEMYPIDPLIAKDTHGKSMPSRHMGSAVILACTFTWLWWPLGIVSWMLCGGIAFTRIVGGVHFPRDVVAAIALALACGLIGYVLIP